MGGERTESGEVVTILIFSLSLLVSVVPACQTVARVWTNQQVLPIWLVKVAAVRIYIAGQQAG